MKINGTAGDDYFPDGTAGADQIKLFAGNDVAGGGQGNDSIGGGLGNDYLLGGNGNDRIWGAEGNDSIFGGGDTEESGAGADYLSGGPGNDLVALYWSTGHAVGGAGNDMILHEGNGAARCDGGSGDDLIYNAHGISSGDAGNDRLEALLADPARDGDVLIPGTGHSDVDFRGGAGADTFAVTGDIRWQGNNAVIRDFHATQGDKVSLGIVDQDGIFYGTEQTFNFLDADHNGRLTGADGTAGGAVSDNGSGLDIGLVGNMLHMSGVHLIDWSMVS